jgi:hypothetical protein
MLHRNMRRTILWHEGRWNDFHLPSFYDSSAHCRPSLLPDPTSLATPEPLPVQAQGIAGRGFADIMTGVKNDHGHLNGETVCVER